MQQTAQTTANVARRARWLPLAAALAATAAHAHGTAGDDHGASHAGGSHAEHTAAARASDAQVTLPDAELLTQDGDSLRFRSDALGGKLVVVSFFYTSCQTTCPVTSAILRQVQARLGDRLERDVRLVSVTVDPGTDTPARLKAYSSRFGRKPGWIWLTGEKQNVDRVLAGLGAYAADYTQHPLTVLVGDPLSGHWQRLFGFASPEDIVTRIEALAARRAHAAAPAAVTVQ